MDKAVPNKNHVYDFIKIAAEIFVVFAHITAMYSTRSAIPQPSFSRVLNAMFSFFAIGIMPVYMCICGAVYNYCIGIGKYRDRVKFIGNKFMRLMVPYFAFSLLMVGPVVTGLGVTYYNYGEFVVKGSLLCGYTRHLWFCVVLFIIFILCDIFRDTLQKASPLLILPIVCVLSYLGTQWMAKYFQLHLVLYHSLFFYLGMLIDRYWEKLTAFLRKYTLPCALLGAAMCLSLYVLEHATYLVAFGSILFTFAVSVRINVEALEKRHFYQVVKRDSFGIYLAHPMLLYIIFYLLRNTYTDPSLTSIICLVFVYFLSLLLSELLRRVGLGLFLGEKIRKQRPKKAQESS